MEQLLKLLDSPVLVRVAQLAALVLARVLPLVVLTPVFGGQTVPARFRFGLGVVLTVGLLPVVLAAGGGAVPGAMFTLLLLKESLVGLTLAMFVLTMFEAIAASGVLSDLARGAASATLFDPHAGGQKSVLGVFSMQLAIVLFLTVGGHRLLLTAFGNSFSAIAVTELIPAGMVGPRASEAMIGLVSHLFAAAVQLAAPVLVVMFLTDACLGLINRVAPQVQVFFLGLTIKSTLAILILCLTLGIFFDLLTLEFGRGLSALRDFIAGAT